MACAEAFNPDEDYEPEPPVVFPLEFLHAKQEMFQHAKHLNEEYEPEPPEIFPHSKQLKIIGFPPSSAAVRDKQAEFESEAPKEDALEEEIEENIGTCAYFLFYIILFFAFWFGSHRFDQDGDGDFDTQDMKILLDAQIMQLKRWLYWKNDASGKKAAFPVFASPRQMADRGPLSPAASTSTVPHAESSNSVGTSSVGRSTGSEDIRASPRSVHTRASQDTSITRITRREALEIQLFGPRFAAARAKPKKRNEALDTVKIEPLQSQASKTSSEAPAGFSSTLDRNGDGVVDLRDVLESTVSGLDSNDYGQEMQIWENIRNGSAKPLFIVIQCSTCIVLWLVFVIKESIFLSESQAGLDSIYPGKTEMRLYDDACGDLRSQAWRYFSYQFTHKGVLHIIINTIQCLLLGIPLEAFHGTIKMLLMFNLGVFGGACCCAVSATHSTVVGMSGGCYALLGMHLADLIMNWKQKRFRKPTLFMLLVLAEVDIVSSLFVNIEGVSHAAHVGGYVLGTLMGIVIGTNLVVKKWERILQVIACFIGLGLLIFCGWWVTLWPPRNLWESTGWCWVRQVWNETHTPGDWICVTCSDQACIEQWSLQLHLRSVDIGQCSNKWL